MPSGDIPKVPYLAAPCCRLHVPYRQASSRHVSARSGSSPVFNIAAFDRSDHVNTPDKSGAHILAAPNRPKKSEGGVRHCVE
jgi:hypothetical protein